MPSITSLESRQPHTNFARTVHTVRASNRVQRKTRSAVNYENQPKEISKSRVQRQHHGIYDPREKQKCRIVNQG